MKTAKPRTCGQIPWFKLALAAGMLLVLGLMLNGRVDAFSNPGNAPSAAPAADVFEGITLSSGVTDADAAFLGENLEFLRDHMPAWWMYLESAKPLSISVDLNAGAQGRAAFTRCCEENVGVIVFGFHFDQMTLAGNPSASSLTARRVAFLAILVHEATHVQDYRAGRFTVRTDYTACVEVERAGLSKQLQFERAVLSLAPGDDTIGVQGFGGEIENSIFVETRALGSRETWLTYCGDLLD